MSKLSLMKSSNLELNPKTIQWVQSQLLKTLKRQEWRTTWWPMSDAKRDGSRRWRRFFLSRTWPSPIDSSPSLKWWKLKDYRGQIWILVNIGLMGETDQYFKKTQLIMFLVDVLGTIVYQHWGLKGRFTLSRRRSGFGKTEKQNAGSSKLGAL